MKSFVLSMLVGVGLATAATVVAVRAFFPDLVDEPPTAQRAPGPSAARFSQFDAIEVVAARLGSGPKAERMGHSLRTGARVTYHSPAHWTVRFNDASWTAHGSGQGESAGPYAEPDNDAARTYEHEAQGP